MRFISGIITGAPEDVACEPSCPQANTIPSASIQPSTSASSPVSAPSFTDLPGSGLTAGSPFDVDFDAAVYDTVCCWNWASEIFPSHRFRSQYPSWWPEQDDEDLEYLPSSSIGAAGSRPRSDSMEVRSCLSIYPTSGAQYPYSKHTMLLVLPSVRAPHMKRTLGRTLKLNVAPLRPGLPCLMTMSPSPASQRTLSSQSLPHRCVAYLSPHNASTNAASLLPQDVSPYKSLFTGAIVLWKKRVKDLLTVSIPDYVAWTGGPNIIAPDTRIGASMLLFLLRWHCDHPDVRQGKPMDDFETSFRDKFPGSARDYKCRVIRDLRELCITPFSMIM